MARKFFYICAGMLMLALSYHFGFATASAQAPGNPVVAADVGRAFTANGDVYADGGGSGVYTRIGNVFGSGPTPTQRESWGQVKARYHATPGMTATPGADSK